MKVLILGRTGLFDNLGGDRIQIENTAEELRKLGVEVDVRFGIKNSYHDYDLVHIFQLDWNTEAYYQTQEAKKYNKPVILSPIHHNIEEVKRFDDNYVFDFRRISKIIFKNQFHRDELKDIYRAIFSPKKTKLILKSIITGYRNLYIKTLKMVDMVLVQTVQEAKDLEKTFNVKIKWEKVTNGVSKHFLIEVTEDNPFDFINYFLCVGRIEPRKNQLNVIEAISQLRKEKVQDFNLVLIGKTGGLKHFEYNYLFNRLVRKNPWIHHIESVPYYKMPIYYKYAKVCVSASWFETTGLTSLEAIFQNTNAVASGNRAKELLGDYVSYCDPGDLFSIKDALLHEYYSPRPVINDEMKANFTWENAAKITLDVYNNTLKGNK